MTVLPCSCWRARVCCGDDAAFLVPPCVTTKIGQFTSTAGKEIECLRVCRGAAPQPAARSASTRGSVCCRLCTAALTRLHLCWVSGTCTLDLSGLGHALPLSLSHRLYNKTPPEFHCNCPNRRDPTICRGKEAHERVTVSFSKQKARQGDVRCCPEQSTQATRRAQQHAHYEPRHCCVVVAAKHTSNQRPSPACYSIQ